MPDQKISEDELISSFSLDMYIPLVDPNEALAEDRNKRLTFETLFGAVTVSGVTPLSLIISPHVYIYNGGSTATWTLPEGAADIVNLTIVICNLGSGDLNIQGFGGDLINNGDSDPFNIPGTYDKTAYAFRWTGTTWIIT